METQKRCFILVLSAAAKAEGLSLRDTSVALNALFIGRRCAPTTRTVWSVAAVEYFFACLVMNSLFRLRHRLFFSGALQHRECSRSSTPRQQEVLLLGSVVVPLSCDLAHGFFQALNSVVDFLRTRNCCHLKRCVVSTQGNTEKRLPMRR